MIETQRERNGSEPRWQAFVWVVTVAILLALPAAGVEQEIRKSFDARPGGLLELDTDHGSIEVRTHAEPRVDILVLMETRGDRDNARKRFDDFRVSFEPVGNGLKIEGEDHGKSGGFFGFPRLLERVTCQMGRHGSTAVRARPRDRRRLDLGSGPEG